MEYTVTCRSQCSSCKCCRTVGRASLKWTKTMKGVLPRRVGYHQLQTPPRSVVLWAPSLNVKLSTGPSWVKCQWWWVSRSVVGILSPRKNITSSHSCQGIYMLLITIVSYYLKKQVVRMPLKRPFKHKSVSYPWINIMVHPITRAVFVPQWCPPKPGPFLSEY